jgi:ABC-type Co2+ transport system permease subunit
MHKTTAYVTRLTVTTILLMSLAQATLAQRVKQLDKDRGDIPGWAIAAAAACVFGALVYAAVSGVVAKYTARIK